MNPIPFAFLGTVVGGDGGGPVTELVTAFGFGFDVSSTSSSEVGYKFTVGASPITVTDLGYRRETGTYANRTVNLRNNAGTLIASASPVFNSVSVGALAYATIGAPVVLSAAGVYHITSARNSGGNFNEFRGSGTLSDVTLTADATINDFTDENQSNVGGFVGYVSLKYTL